MGSFADLAKQAREQAEQLSTQLPTSAASLNKVSDGLSSYGVTSVGGLFNLDSIQSTVDEEDAALQEQQRQQQQKEVMSDRFASEVIEFGNDDNTEEQQSSLSNNNAECQSNDRNEDENVASNDIVHTQQQDVIQ